MMALRLLRIGTRGSALALAQSRAVMRRLQEGRPALAIEEVVIRTAGDRWSEKNLPGPAPGKGVFTAEFGEALRRGDIDVAVHSLKDLPADPSPGLALAAVPLRADPRDVLISKMPGGWEALPPRAIVATGSARRRDQLARRRPDLAFAPIRGNLDTRVRRLREHEAWAGIIVAAAGVERLQPDLAGLHVAPFAADVMLPAPGQGALGLEAREHDREVAAILEDVHDFDTGVATLAERAFLRALGGGCQAPAGALAWRREDGAFVLSARYWRRPEDAPTDGSTEFAAADAERSGRELAQRMLKVALPEV